MDPALQGKLIEYMVVVGGPMGVLTVIMFFISRKDNLRYAEDLKNIYERHTKELTALVTRWDDRNRAFEQIVKDNTAASVALREGIMTMGRERRADPPVSRV
jgi:hypothetical protein